ncbi:hypothetical protein RYX36_018718 [Vicia faba]
MAMNKKKFVKNKNNEAKEKEQICGIPTSRLHPPLSTCNSTTTIHNSTNTNFSHKKIVNATHGYQHNQIVPEQSQRIQIENITHLRRNNVTITTNFIRHRRPSSNTTKPPAATRSADQSNETIWASTQINKNSTFNNKNPILQLLDTGNLIVTESRNENDSTRILWQSFDFPTDTLLPGMKLDWNFDTNTETYINS